MEGELRALATDLRATNEDLCGAIYEIKTWHGKEDTAKKHGVGSVNRKSHQSAVKGGRKATPSWTTGIFPTITLGWRWS